jgi:hypothetical protein
MDVPASAQPLLLLGAVRATEHGQWGLAIDVVEALDPEEAIRALLSMLVVELRERSRLTGTPLEDIYDRLELHYRLSAGPVGPDVGP